MFAGGLSLDLGRAEFIPASQPGQFELVENKKEGSPVWTTGREGGLQPSQRFPDLCGLCVVVLGVCAQGLSDDIYLSITRRKVLSTESPSRNRA